MSNKSIKDNIQNSNSSDIKNNNIERSNDNPSQVNKHNAENNKLNDQSNLNNQNTNNNKIGDYLVQETLGEGAFGKVKLAIHLPSNEKVAIKILNKKRMLEISGDITKIQKEINILKKMRHKNIIQLYEILESRNNLFLVTEYCPKGELFDYIVKKKRLNEVTACKLFQNLIDGIEYLHSQNIVHRDLKPENLLLDEKGNLKITDFGLSTYYNGKISTPCGTPSYAPPEMLRGETYVGEKSDLWSCGIILFAMLCGYLPFAESKEEIIIEKVVNNDYKVPDYLSPKAKDLLAKLMEINPEKRIGIRQIKEHPWFKLVEAMLRPGIQIGINQIPVDENILSKVVELSCMKEYYKSSKTESTSQNTNNPTDETQNNKLSLNEEFIFQDKNKLKQHIRKKIQDNKFENFTACYYLLLKNHIVNGGISVSDLQSKLYLNFITNPNNLIDCSGIIYADHAIKGDSKIKFSPKRIKSISKQTEMTVKTTTSSRIKKSINTLESSKESGGNLNSGSNSKYNNGEHLKLSIRSNRNEIEKSYEQQINSPSKKFLFIKLHNYGNNEKPRCNTEVIEEKEVKERQNEKKLKAKNNKDINKPNKTTRPSKDINDIKKIGSIKNIQVNNMSNSNLVGPNVKDIMIAKPKHISALPSPKNYYKREENFNSFNKDKQSDSMNNNNKSNKVIHLDIDNVSEKTQLSNNKIREKIQSPVHCSIVPSKFSTTLNNKAVENKVPTVKQKYKPMFTVNNQDKHQVKSPLKFEGSESKRKINSENANITSSRKTFKTNRQKSKENNNKQSTVNQNKNNVDQHQKNKRSIDYLKRESIVDEIMIKPNINEEQLNALMEKFNNNSNSVAPQQQSLSNQNVVVCFNNNNIKGKKASLDLGNTSNITDKKNDSGVVQNFKDLMNHQRVYFAKKASMDSENNKNFQGKKVKYTQRNERNADSNNYNNRKTTDYKLPCGVNNTFNSIITNQDPNNNYYCTINSNLMNNNGDINLQSIALNSTESVENKTQCTQLTENEKIQIDEKNINDKIKQMQQSITKEIKNKPKIKNCVKRNFNLNNKSSNIKSSISKDFQNPGINELMNINLNLNNSKQSSNLITNQNTSNINLNLKDKDKIIEIISEKMALKKLKSFLPKKETKNSNIHIEEKASFEYIKIDSKKEIKDDDKNNNNINDNTNNNNRKGTNETTNTEDNCVPQNTKNDENQPTLKRTKKFKRRLIDAINSTLINDFRNNALHKSKVRAISEDKSFNCSNLSNKLKLQSQNLNANNNLLSEAFKEVNKRYKEYISSEVNRKNLILRFVNEENLLLDLKAIGDLEKNNEEFLSHQFKSVVNSTNSNENNDENLTHRKLNPLQEDSIQGKNFEGKALIHDINFLEVQNHFVKKSNFTVFKEYSKKKNYHHIGDGRFKSELNCDTNISDINKIANKSQLNNNSYFKKQILLTSVDQQYSDNNKNKKIYQIISNSFNFDKSYNEKTSPSSQSAYKKISNRNPGIENNNSKINKFYYNSILDKNFSSNFNTHHNNNKLNSTSNIKNDTKNPKIIRTEVITNTENNSQQLTKNASTTNNSNNSNNNKFLKKIQNINFHHSHSLSKSKNTNNIQPINRDFHIRNKDKNQKFRDVSAVYKSDIDYESSDEEKHKSPIKQKLISFSKKSKKSKDDNSFSFNSLSNSNQKGILNFNTEIIDNNKISYNYLSEKYKDLRSKSLKESKSNPNNKNITQEDQEITTNTNMKKNEENKLFLKGKESFNQKEILGSEILEEKNLLNKKIYKGLKKLIPKGRIDIFSIMVSNNDEENNNNTEKTETEKIKEAKLVPDITVTKQTNSLMSKYSKHYGEILKNSNLNLDKDKTEKVKSNNNISSSNLNNQNLNKNIPINHNFNNSNIPNPSNNTGKSMNLDYTLKKNNINPTTVTPKISSNNNKIISNLPSSNSISNTIKKIKVSQQSNSNSNLNKNIIISNTSINSPKNYVPFSPGKYKNKLN